MAIEQEMLITLTADIVSAHVSNNTVGPEQVTQLIETVYGALAGAGAPPAPTEPEKPKGAVSVRASIKPDFLVSMIDGKPYRMLKRHLSLNGYTPEGYREAFDLPANYPMVAASYAEKRRELAKQIGLGRKPGTKMTKPAATSAQPAAKPGKAAAKTAKPAAAPVEAAAKKASPGRPRKTASPKPATQQAAQDTPATES